MTVTHKPYPQPIRTPTSSRYHMLPALRGRRGISPLVATVLLLAFAVAVGTMVVNYVSGTLRVDPCDNVGVALEGNACFSAGTVTFALTNTGSKEIVNLKIRLVNDNTKDVSEPQVANNLGPSGAAKVSFPYETISPESVAMTVIPVVEGKNGPVYCQDGGSIRTQLKAC